MSEAEDKVREQAAGDMSQEILPQAEAVETLSFPEVIKKVEQLLEQLSDFAQVRAELVNQVEQMEITSATTELSVLIRRIPPATGSDYTAVLEGLEKQVQLAKLVEVAEDQPESASTLSEQLTAVDNLLKFIAGDGAVRQLVEYVTLHETQPGRAAETMVRICLHFNRGIQFINDKIDRLNETGGSTEEATQQRMELITAFQSRFKEQLAELRKHNLASEITDEQVDVAFLALRKSSMRTAASKYYTMLDVLVRTKRELFDTLAVATQTDEHSIRAQALRLAATQPNPGKAAECMSDLQQFTGDKSPVDDGNKAS